MDAEFICPRLKKWARLFYGSDAKVFAKEMDDGRFVFGTKENKSTLTKAVAIFLCIGELTDAPKQTKVKNSTTKRTKIKRRRLL